MGTTKMKAIELILDWNLWPRHEAHGLDGTNLRRIKEALNAGVKLPPVKASEDFRVIDGFHRIRATLDTFGDDATIDVELCHYESEGEMFLDAMRLNASQGLSLDEKDRAHAILKARRLKIPFPAIALALGKKEKDLKEFLKTRTARTKEGEIIPLPYGAKNLAGKVLNEAEEHYARKAGALPEMFISMLLNALRAHYMNLTEKTRKRLEDLRDEINKILEDETA